MLEQSSKYHSQEYYARELQKHLPKEWFLPVPRRLLWLLFHYTIITGCVFVILRQPPFIVQLLASMLMGCSLGILGYLGHEIIHGSVVRGRRLILLFGGICMLPWGLHPRAWITWHNRVHHRYTQHGFYDPDTFGWDGLYKRSRWYQHLEKVTPGSRTLRSYFFLFYWFSFQTAATVFLRPDVIKSPRDRRTFRLYLVAVLLLWAAGATLAAPYGFLLLFILPLAMSNLMMMGYIATNHFLNPLTESVNDPLINSLTVRSTRLVEWFHLYNNFHIEHHVLPSLNPVYAPRVAELIKKFWGANYQEMNHIRALRRVYQTPRFYLRETVHLNPRTRQTERTLLAHYLEM